MDKKRELGAKLFFGGALGCMLLLGIMWLTGVRHESMMLAVVFFMVAFVGKRMMVP